MEFVVKTITMIVGCMLLASLATDVDAATKKKLHSNSTVAPAPKLNREELESGGAIDAAVGSHCPKSHIKFLKCESDGDFKPYQHPADGDGPWWFGPYTGD